MQTKKTTLLLIRILEKILSDTTVHARWLNTLSFLEYIGARKMLKALPAEQLDFTLLSHIQEESRHSLYFKKLAQKVLGKNLYFKKEEMICSQQAEEYFQNVDQKAQTFCRKNPTLNYLYTTYMVEIRALSVYNIYNKILERKEASFRITNILTDEEAHMDFVIKAIKRLDPLADYNCEELKKAEHSFYFSLLHHLEEEVLLNPANTSAYLLKEQKPERLHSF